MSNERRSAMARQMRRYVNGNLRSVPMRTRDAFRRVLQLKRDPRRA